MKHTFFILLIFTTISVSLKAQQKADSVCCCKDSVPCFSKNEKISILYNHQPAQDKLDIILDFRAKALGIPNNLKIKKGEFIRVKVVNYNPFLYKVNIDNRDSSAPQPNDAGFLGMFLSPDKFSSVAANLISTIGAPPKSILAAPSQTPTQAQIKSFKNNNVMSNGINDSDIISLLKQLLDTASIVETLLDNYVDDTKNKKIRIRQLRTNIEASFAEISKQFALLQKSYLSCGDLNPDDLNAKATTFETQLKSMQQETRNISSVIFDSSVLFKFDIAFFNSYINDKPWFKIKSTYIDSFYKIAGAELTGIDTSVSSKKINEMYAAFIKLGQNSTCFTSLPFYVGNDIKVFTINLKPVDDKSNLPSYQTSFSIPNYQAKIWGISGGIFVSGLYNEIYSNKRTTNDTTYNLVLDGQGKLQIGVNALAYTGWQLNSTKPNYVGVCFGAGMSIEAKPKPRVLLGASYISGEKNRVIFSAGITGGFVSRKSDAFLTTTNYAKPAENYQKDIMKPSAFFSINYSFLNK